MSRNGAGVYSLPPIYEAVSGNTILATQHNTPLEDLEADANAARPVVAGGTGADDEIGAIDNIWTEGSSVASAATLNLDTTTGVMVDVTGNTGPITAVTLGAGKYRLVRFASTPTINVGASLIGNNGGSNIGIAAGDWAFFRGYSGGIVRFMVMRLTGYTISNAVITGTYTPTLTGVTNVQASTAHPLYWVRSGSYVQVFGPLQLDPTAAASTQLDISLPIASDFSTGLECAGVANAQIAQIGGRITGNATDNRASLFITTSGTANMVLGVVFGYEII